MEGRARRGRPGLIAAGVLVLALLAPALGRADEACYRRLLDSPSASATSLGECIRVQSELFKREAATAAGAKYLYRLGRLYTMLHHQTQQQAHLEAAIDHYRRLTNHYPRSSLADDAQYQIGRLFLEEKKDKVSAYAEFRSIEVKYPRGDMAPLARAELASLDRELLDRPKDQKPAEEAPPPRKDSSKNEESLPPAEPAAGAGETGTPPAARPGPAGELPQVTGVRHWSTASYTRVVVDLTGQVQFKSHLLRPDPDLDKPARLYLDLSRARLGPRGEQEVTIGDGLLRQARLGQYDASTVRVVLDIHHIDGFKVFALDSPPRVVIDVAGSKKALAKAPAPPSPASQVRTNNRRRLPRGRAGEEASPDLTKQLALGVRTVVVDPGHGGRDPGCATCRAGLMEKDITLAVGLKVAEKLRSRLGLNVVLTRDSDRSVPLEERTALANTTNADLFISIHVNAAKSTQLAGLETYFLNLATDERAIQVAARENATSTKSISDLQNILNDLMLNTKINESNRLAFQIQRGLIDNLSRYYKVRSLGVKQAPFYVLLGAQMPAVLVEIGFGTNRTECARLSSDKYLDRVAEGIHRGVQNYIRQIKGGG